MTSSITAVFHLCADVCLLAGVCAGLGLGEGEAAARGGMGGGSPRCHEVVDGHGSQQHSRYRGQSYHTPGILEEEVEGEQH